MAANDHDLNQLVVSVCKLLLSSAEIVEDHELNHYRLHDPVSAFCRVFGSRISPDATGINIVFHHPAGWGLCGVTIVLSDVYAYNLDSDIISRDPDTLASDIVADFKEAVLTGHWLETQPSSGGIRWLTG
jgi:hypothetical protein